MPTPLVLPAIIGAVASVAGVASQAEAQRKAQRAQQEQLDLQRQGLTAAEEANKPATESLAEMLRLAKEYNPAKDTDAAVSYASTKTLDTLQNALRGLNASYRAGSGVPGLGTEFNVRAQGLTDRVADPLREFAATQKANEFAKKMAALQMVNGGNAGNLAANFFAASQGSANAIQNSGYNPAAMGFSLGNLGDSLSRLFPANDKPGAGGTGDTPRTGGSVTALANAANTGANQETMSIAAINLMLRNLRNFMPNTGQQLQHQQPQPQGGLL